MGALQKVRLLPVLILFSCGVFAQSGKLVRLGFYPFYNHEPLQLGKSYYSENQKDYLAFSTFKLYISKLRFYNKGQRVHEAADSFYLIDANDPESLNRAVTVPYGLVWDELRFYLGIDDTTNNEGIGNGDLDPAKGMYWAWQTGYINMKLEGTTKAGKEFQFHLGGFLEHKSFQEISLKSASDTIPVRIDIAKFINGFSFNDTSMIMSPSEKAVELSQKAAQMFFIP